MKLSLSKIAFILVALCAFALGMKQLREPDVWWQLLAGRWMLEHGSVTHTDVFSYTMQGANWINIKWLYEVIIAFLEKGLGPEAVLLLQSIANVAIVWLLYKTIRLLSGTTSNILAAVVSLIAFLAISEYRMAGRPEMVSHLLSTAYLFLLWRNPRFEWKSLLLFIPLQCLWANMHEGYPVGLVILATATVGSFISYLFNKEKQALLQTGRIAAVFVLSLLAVLCNPNGIVLWQQPFEIYRQVWANKYTTELYSYADIQYWTIQAKLHITILALVTFYWIIQLLTAIKQKQLKQFLSPVLAGYLLMIPLFAYLSLTANRNIPFAQIVLIPSLPIVLSWLFTVSRLRAIKLLNTISEKADVIAIAVTALFYVAIVSNKWYAFTKSPNKYGIHVAMLNNPTGAADFIKQNNIKGTAFSDYFISSYLLWGNYPDFKSYIDLRDLDVFPANFFDDYFSIYQQPSKFTELDKKYNFDYVVLSTSQLGNVQFNLYWGKDYNLIYVDPVASIFLKYNNRNKSLNENKQIQKLFNWPAPIEDAAWASGLSKLLNPVVEYSDEDGELQGVYASRFYNLMKNYRLSLQLLRSAPQDNVKTLVALGQTYLQWAGAVPSDQERRMKADSAQIYLEQAEEADPSEKSIYSAEGSLFALKGNYDKAAESIQKFLSYDQSNDYMYYLYGFSNRMLWKAGDETKLSDVISAMKTSLKLNPMNGKASLYLAEAYLAKADNDNARKCLKEAIESGNPWLPQEQQLLDMMKHQLGV